MSSSARLGTMRVRWMCSGFSPRLRLSLSFCLIQSSRSRTESQPTQSLMRWRGIVLVYRVLGRFDHHDLARLPQLAAPAPTGTSVTTPANGARSVCSIFIASITARRWPAATRSPTRDVDLQHPAVHRRLDDAVAGTGLRGRGGKILDAHAGLAAVAQDISLVAGLEHPRVGRRARRPRSQRACHRLP